MAKPTAAAPAGDLLSIVRLTGLTTNASFEVPAGYGIQSIFLQSHINDWLPEIDFCLSPGDVAVAKLRGVAANASLVVPSGDAAQVLRRVWFSSTDTTTVLIEMPDGPVDCDMQIVLIKIQ